MNILISLGLVLAFGAIMVFIAYKLTKSGSSSSTGTGRKFADRSEAMFKSMFPDLQPHFHPRAVHAFVKARRARQASTGPYTWTNPPGFDAAASAEIVPEGLRDKVRLLDPTGAAIGQFIFEEHNEGGVIRMGQGKFTADVRGSEPRVRYWHPDREFKWTPTKWTFQSRVADREIDSDDDRGTSWSSSSSSSDSSARTAAAAGGLMGAGGAFDGGGATQGWDESSSSSGDSSSGDSSSGATSPAY
jgi:hypothetical protein